MVSFSSLPITLAKRHVYSRPHPRPDIPFPKKNLTISSLPNSLKSYVPNQHQTCALLSFTHKKAPNFTKIKIFPGSINSTPNHLKILFQLSDTSNKTTKYRTHLRSSPDNAHNLTPHPLSPLFDQGYLLLADVPKAISTRK